MTTASPAEQTAPSHPYRIAPVNNAKMLDTFIRLPWRIFRNDPAWIPPLLVERREHLSPKNPYFAHAEVQLWVAYRDDRPVGRVSAQIDALHQSRYDDRTGFFGMFDAENDAALCAALFATAEQWLKTRGMTRSRGPFNLSINQECGLLVRGFDTPPMVMMGHAPPYYHELVTQCGYAKVKDLLAYQIAIDFAMPPLVQRALQKAEGSITIRPLNRKRFSEELDIIRSIFEDAWSQNWGFLPFSLDEFAALGKELRLLVDDEFVQIAEVDGSPAAMMVAFPNVNELIRDLNGKLLPWGWAKFLWRLKVTRPATARVALMGVRRRYHDTPLGAILAFGMIDATRTAGRARGIQTVELSWILEDNVRMCNMLDAIKAVPYKTYRLYEKAL